MLQSTRKRSRLLAISVPVLGVLALGSTSAFGASSPVASHLGAVSASEQAKVLAYWTPARREEAKSVGLAAGATTPNSQSTGGPDGPPTAHVGTLPSGVSAATAVEQPVLASQPWSYPYPYDAFGVPTSLYKTYPYDLNGTIFFTNGGAGYKCSGTSIQNGHFANEIDTAGHCVASTEGVTGFDESAEFIPAYNGNGKTTKEIEPYGTYPATYFYTANEWINNRNFDDDFGSMLLGRSKKKKELSSEVGTSGWAYNYSDNEQYVELGYPGEPPYNGTTLEENIAASAPCSEGDQVCTGSPFTGGSSGGSWYIDWSSTGGYINGHTDWVFGSAPLTKYSPYYNNLWYEIHCLGKTSEC